MVRNTDRLEVACVGAGGAGSLLMLATVSMRHRLASQQTKNQRGFGGTIHENDRWRRGVCGSKQLPRPVPDDGPEAVYFVDPGRTATKR